MKRFFLSFWVFLSFTGMVSAQDTIDVLALPDNYYHCGCWGEFGDEPAEVYVVFSADEDARGFYTPDSIRVYGLAVAMVTDRDLYGHFLDNHIDTSSSNVFEYLKLFQYSTVGRTMTQMGEELLLHADSNNVAYYLNLGFGTLPVVPMSELYFSSPQTVRDTFYLSITGQHYAPFHSENPDSIHFRDYYPRVTVIALGTIDKKHPCYHRPVARMSASDSSWMFTHEALPMILMLFPIFSPIETDTTVTPIDTTTTGVSRVDMVGRYVSVSPNPAGDRATVLSSFGLTCIEAYDPQGRQLYAAPATGLRTTLDVSTWPRGTAFLHIHTPAGTTVKKLLLR